MRKIIIVFGTRPEAIKMAPLITKLNKNNNFDLVVVSTGQHEDMVKDILQKLEIKVHYNLQIMKKNQQLNDITINILEKFNKVIEKEKPNIVLVHGDTTTSFAAALSSFYKKIKIGHIESGLRTYNKYSPYPEEFNRQAIASLSDLHFAPTKKNYNNLINEGKKKEDIYITGNTGIDTLKYSLENNLGKISKENEEFIGNNKLILVTAHRRENIGKKMEEMFNGIKKLALTFNDIRIIYPVHLNPKVQKLAKKILSNIKNIRLTTPMEVFDFHFLMKKSYFILTDSGGIQEEASYLGKPVIVMRDNSERDENKDRVLHIIGTDSENIFNFSKKLILDEKSYKKYSNKTNLFGNGNSSEKIINILEQRVKT